MGQAMMGIGLAAQIGGGIASMVGAEKTANNEITQYQFDAFSSNVNSMVDKSNANIATLNSSIQLMNASLADTNSQIAILGAQHELAKGQQQIGQLTMQAGQVEGTQKAQMAAQGIDITQGSAAEVVQSSELVKRMDVQTITANAARSAFGYEVESMNDQAQATSDRMNALGYQMQSTSDMMKSVMDTNQANLYSQAAASVSPTMNVMGSMLGSIGGVANTWALGKQVGAWGE